MLRFALLEAARLVSILIGAAFLTVAVASLDSPTAMAGAGPFFATFAGKIASTAAFDFGSSVVSGRPVLIELAERLPETAILFAAGGVIACLIGIPLGLLFAAGPLRRAAAPLIQIVAAAPVFCAALALAWIANRFLHWPVDVTGAATSGAAALDFANPLPALKVLALPAITVGAAGAAALQLSLRRAASEIADAPWRAALRRFGLPAGEIDRVYVAPQVASSVAYDLGEFALVLLSACAVAEWVFNRPGAAVLFVKSVALADWSMAALVLFAFAAIKLVADFIGAILAHALADASP